MAEDQTLAAEKYGEIVDVPFPQVAPEAASDEASDEVREQANKLVDEIIDLAPEAVMAMGFNE